MVSCSVRKSRLSSVAAHARGRYPRDVEPVLLVAVLQQHVVRPRLGVAEHLRAAPPRARGRRPPTRPPARRRDAAPRAAARGTARGRAPRWRRARGSRGRCRRRAAPGRTTPRRASASAIATSATTTVDPLVGEQRRAVGDGAVAHPVDQRLLDLDDRALLDPRVGEHLVHA